MLLSALLVLAACSQPSANQRQVQQPPVSAGTGGGAGTSDVFDAGSSTSFDAGHLPTPAIDAGDDAGIDAAPPPLTPITIDACGPDNAAQLSAGAISALMAASDPAGIRLLYPYDGTVFPRGLTAPLVMWDGSDASAVYVHLSSSLFDYKGCLQPTAAGQLQLPQDVWDMAGTRAQGASDPFKLELAVLDGGVAHGLAKASLVIANAALKGSIYYNSYSSLLNVQPDGNQRGAVLRIRQGQPVEIFLGKTTCTGCHSLSANGERLLAQADPDGTSDPAMRGGSVWKLDETTPPEAAALRSNAVGVEFAGVYPDGSLYLETSRGLNSTTALAPTSTGTVTSLATLYETDTGVVLDSSKTGIPFSAVTPSFSPSGKLLAFNDSNVNLGASLTVMDFDVSQRRATNSRVIYTAANGLYPGWPFSLPDDRAVVFAVGAFSDLSSGGASPTARGTDSDLLLADVTTGQAHVLARAMGFTTDDTSTGAPTYLAFPGELHQSYYPTVSPVAAGGYFWVFFDSVRHYGSLGLQRALWGFAIDVHADGSYTSDASHPAFYLPGQEFGTSNHRAFTALDPCKLDGQSCETGIDCCGGFCEQGRCGKPPPDKPRCSKTDEACETGADCCNHAESCINHFCEIVVQ